MPLNNPIRQLYCPYCSEKFYPGECRIEATVPYKSGKIDISAGQILQDPHKGVFARTSVTPLTNALYTRTQAVRICLHCDSPLPFNFDQAENHTIAIIGGSNSGVSTYIGTLLHELKEGKLLIMYNNMLGGDLTPYSNTVLRHGSK